jgi:glucose/arabinose dehydrogenase
MKLPLSGVAVGRWRGDILMGGLSAKGIVRVDLDGNTVRGEHRIELGQRIRDVAQGPDGAVYALTDQTDGEILRLSPAGGGD